MSKRSRPSIEEAGQFLIGHKKSDKWLRLWKEFIDSEKAHELFRELMKLDEEQNNQLFTQKPAPFNSKTPRKTAAYGDEGVVYRYGRVVEETLPWIPSLDKLRKVLSNLLGVDFNFVLINLYRDGNDKVGWHQDDEKELVPGVPIASVSLGAPRDFDVRVIRNKKDKTRVALEHGDLVVMGGEEFQNYYQHSIPQRKRVKDPRLNLTFRVVKK